MPEGVVVETGPDGVRRVNWKRYALIALATVVAAVVANMIVYFVGSAIITIDSRFLPLVNVSPVIIFTLPPAIIATLVYAALLRFTNRPERTFTIIAAVILVVTLIPDFLYIPTVVGATSGQTALLVLMHVVAAVVIVGMLTTLAPADAEHGRPRPRNV